MERQPVGSIQIEICILKSAVCNLSVFLRGFDSVDSVEVR